MKQNIQSKKINTRLIAVGLLVAGITLAVFAFYQYGATRKEDDVTDTRPVNSVDYSPPSEQEIQETERRKTELQNSSQDTPENTGQKTIVSPIITYAGQYDAAIEVSAYVNGVYEDGGECTYTFSSVSGQIKKTTAGSKAATNTSCEYLTFPSSELSKIFKGTWSLTVYYSSSSAQGSSSSATFEVK